MIGVAEIRTPVKGFTGKVAGVNFVDGIGTTTDERSLAYFRRHGYGIGDGAGPEPVEKMTKAELVEHAATAGIDLGEAKTKDDILAAIHAAEDNSDTN